MTYLTDLARDHAAVIAAAPVELRDGLTGIAIRALNEAYDVSGDVKFYLDAETLYYGDNA